MFVPILLALLGVALGGASGYYYRKKQVEERNKDLVMKSEQILADAKNKSKEVIFEARNEAMKLQDEVKKEEQRTHAKLDEIEERLLKKEQVLDHKHDDVEKLRVDLDTKVTSIKQLRD
ncbi:DUF3552 domain-containing protein, partial [Candidatus Gracilibacteria bacterium]|nr:DUF3552 domain-containing protein [Candidatus Gracilibacteria bacterium]